MNIIKNNKLLLKIISTLIAIVLWFAITYTEDPILSQQLNNINVVFLGETQLQERGFTIVNKDNLPSFSAVIRGNRSKVISSLGIVSAAIDVSRLSSPGSHEVLVDYRYPQDTVVLTKTKIGSVFVEIEKLLSRDVPVIVEAIPEEKASENLVALESVTKTITVKGAQSTVEKIAYAKASIDTAQITVDGSMNYDYKLYDKNDNLIDEENIVSKGQTTIPVTGTIFKKAELPVEIVLLDSLKNNYVLKVKKQNVTKLTVGVPQDTDLEKPPVLYAVLGENATKERGPVTLEIQIPQEFYFPQEDNSVTVEYELLPKSVHEIEVIVKAENIPSGKEVTITPEKINISVRCVKSDAVANKIRATFDAQNLNENEETTVKLKVSADENIDIIGEYTAIAKLH